jgi:hypothetical protein
MCKNVFAEVVKFPKPPLPKTPETIMYYSAKNMTKAFASKDTNNLHRSLYTQASPGATLHGARCMSFPELSYQDLQVSQVVKFHNSPKSDQPVETD